MRQVHFDRLAIFLLTGLISACAAPPPGVSGDPVRAAVDAVIRPFIAEHGIPGLAVGIITPDSRRSFVFGVESRETGASVTDRTLFEIGSISKTFTATLAALSSDRGLLDFEDPVTLHVPELAGSALDGVSLLNLATHTSGGMPLQFPDEVVTEDDMIGWYRAWAPTHAPGSMRSYANPSIGLLGRAVARSLGDDFVSLMRKEVFSPLGLTSTWYQLPEEVTEDYAQGYTRAGDPIRLAPGVLAAETYGVRTTVDDLLRFIAANLNRLDLDQELQRAITATHVAWFDVGVMEQALVWERHPWPLTEEALAAASAASIVLEPQPVTHLDPARAASTASFLGKTGATNGFGAYVAFVPELGLGIAILANRNHPTMPRVVAAHRILVALETQ